MRQPEHNELIVSFLTLRKAIGYLGIALPLILVFGGLLLYQVETQSSISSYYHTGMRDFFVGILCSIGVFLWAYRGYDAKDNIAGNFAGFFAIGVALFPTAPIDPSVFERIIGIVHTVFASAFFITLAIISLALFTLGDRTKPGKRFRNAVYRVCGYIMIVAMALIVLYGILPDSVASRFAGLDPVFWLEAIAIVAFGVSWLTKGKGLSALFNIGASKS